MYTNKNNSGRNAGVSFELDILSKPEVCGIIDDACELYACYQWSCMKTINLYPLEFDDFGEKMFESMVLSCYKTWKVSKNIFELEEVLLGFQRTTS